MILNSNSLNGSQWLVSFKVMAIAPKTALLPVVMTITQSKTAQPCDRGGF
jgi:hypothetical protein